MGGKPRFKKFKADIKGLVTPTGNWAHATDGTVEILPNGPIYEHVTIKRTPSYVNMITVSKARFDRGLIIIKQENANNLSTKPEEFFGQQTNEAGKESVEIPKIMTPPQGTFLVFENMIGQNNESYHD